MMVPLGFRRRATCLGARALVGLTLATGGCGGSPAPPAADTLPTVAAPADGSLPPPVLETALPEGVRAMISQPFTGDFDQMVVRRLIRVGVPLNRTFYFVDKGVQRGAAYEMGRALEDHLNKKLRTKDAAKVHVFFVPMPRDLLAKALTQGRIDLAIAQVVVRPELSAIVDFSRPTRTNVSEVVVTGPGAPAIASVDDLSGKDVYVRKDSSGWEALVALNRELEAKGKPPVAVREVPGNLEDDDLLEMVNAGLVPTIVVQDYLAKFWKEIFTDLTVHDAVAVREGASLAVPIRKNSPLLKAQIDAFLAKYGLGTAFGNVIQKRYLVNTSFARQATSEAERKKFRELAGLFKKYGDRYQLDYLLMAAQGYQESGLDQSVKSRVGAVGVMQVMPATGKELAVGDIRQVEPNIHAGVKYIRFVIDQYFKDEPMDDLNKGLFAFASYNAGPARVRQLRQEAGKRGLDPNVWFGNVEQIASERIGRETVTYVSNIYKYYIAYRLATEERTRREAAKKAVRADAR
jgi:membrane-bound lytic murein transglycosylase MltF